MNDLMNESDVNPQAIAGILKAAYMDCEVDQDGDIKIVDDGVKTFLKVDAERKLLTMFNMWPLRASVPMEKKLQWANSLNDEVILTRFSVPRPETLWCDYQMSFAGGVNPYTLVTTYRRFVSVIKGALAQLDKDDFVGRDSSNKEPEATR